MAYREQILKPGSDWYTGGPIRHEERDCDQNCRQRSSVVEDVVAEARRVSAARTHSSTPWARKFCRAALTRIVAENEGVLSALAHSRQYAFLADSNQNSDPPHLLVLKCELYGRNVPAVRPDRGRRSHRQHAAGGGCPAAAPLRVKSPGRSRRYLKKDGMHSRGSRR